MKCDLQLIRTLVVGVTMSIAACGAFAAGEGGTGDVRRVLFLGDSLSDFDRGSNHVDRLQALLQDRMSFCNYAVRGDYIARLVKRLDGEPVFEHGRYADIWSRSYDLAMVFLGHNDTRASSDTGFREPLMDGDAVRVGYERLIAILRAHGISRIILVSPASPDFALTCAKADAALKRMEEGRSAKKRVVRFGDPRLIDEYIAIVRALAAERGVEYLDFYGEMEALPDKTSYFRPSDGVHLTQKGHAWVAAREAAYLKEERPLPPVRGWDNVNPARRFPEPVDVRWRAPFGEGAQAFRIDWRKGAKGRVVFGPDFVRIEKTNDVGSVVVAPRRPVAARKGEVLQAAAGVSLDGAVDPERSRGFIRIYSGRENLNWQRDPCGGKASDAPQFKTFVNAAPGNEIRQLARCVVAASGAACPVIVVEGRRSVSVWRHWTVEGAKEADVDWHERTSVRRAPPDRSATLMDEAAFDRMLAQDGDHVARLVRREEGARLEVDGKGVPPVFYKPIPFGMGVPFTGEGRAFEGAGVNLQVVNIRFGVGGGRIGFWSKDGFDVAGAVRRVKDFMRSAPGSLFLLTIRCDAYPEYAAEHPDEIWRRRDGSPVYGTCSQGEKTPSAKPPAGKWLWVSNHSLVWREDVKRHMTAFVAALRDAGLAKRIVGVHLAGYHDGQFATPAEDFSPCALKAFERWQKEAFGKIRWTGAPAYDDGEFIDPEGNPHAAEYQKFLKWGPMRMQEDLARHLKQAFGKPIVVGRWCMTPYGGALMSTLDFTPFLASDAIDFLVAQPAYHRRAPGLVGGVRVPLASFREHGKLFLNEFDTRTWHGRSGETEPRAIFLSEATDLAMWKTVHRKLAGQMFAQRMGWWYFDMADNWFDEPSILAEIASVRREADARLHTASAWRPSAAFVIDEEGCLLRNRVGRKLSMREAHGTAEQLQRLAGSGVPFDTCVADDFLAKPSRTARYKVLVLCGFYRIDAKRRAFIEKARKTGVRLVFLVDAGALGGADALGDDLRIDEPLGLTAESFGEIVRTAGGYVPTRYGLQVDMNGDFVSVHCIIPGHYDFALPFVAGVTNLKTGERQAGVRTLSLDLVGGETRWYALENPRAVEAIAKHSTVPSRPPRPAR